MINIEKKDNIAILTLNNPKTLNVLSEDVLDELENKIDDISTDNDIRVLILTGVKNSFVAGADISEMAKKDYKEAYNFALKGQRIFNKIENLPFPTIAAINGYAFGGGMELALAFDIRVASNNAMFGQLEPTLGIMTGFGGSQRLPKIIGISKANEYIFTARRFTAQEALNIGLINHVTENALDKALEIANEISNQAPIAIRLSKETIKIGMETNSENGQKTEAHLFSLCFLTEDQKNAMKSFLKKEKYEFKGK